MAMMLEKVMKRSRFKRRVVRRRRLTVQAGLAFFTGYGTVALASTPQLPLPLNYNLNKFFFCLSNKCIIA